MRFALVVTEEMLPLPIVIQTLDDWGFVSVVDGHGNPQIQGNHMHLDGPGLDFVRWLGKYDGVWCTVPGTSPMMQQFEIYHIPQFLVDQVTHKDRKGA